MSAFLSMYHLKRELDASSPVQGTLIRVFALTTFPKTEFLLTLPHIVMSVFTNIVKVVIVGYKKV